MLEIVCIIVMFFVGVWFGLVIYKLGQRHGIVIGRAQLAKELSKKIDADCRKSYEMGYSKGRIDYIRGKVNYYG